jgi:ABC-type dipeptide/oligopeptide/nickel transport system permease component
VYAAVRRYSLFDSGLTIFNYVGYSLPTFWLGLMLITFLSRAAVQMVPRERHVGRADRARFGTDEYWAFVGAQSILRCDDLARTWPAGDDARAGQHRR